MWYIKYIKFFIYWIIILCAVLWGSVWLLKNVIWPQLETWSEKGTVLEQQDTIPVDYNREKD